MSGLARIAAQSQGQQQLAAAAAGAAPPPPGLHPLQNQQQYYYQQLQQHHQQQQRQRQYLPDMLAQPDPSQHITDAMIDSFFNLFHVSYPIVHEATFRAQYQGVIPRPSGASWSVLAYTVAAIGAYTISSSPEALDGLLFTQARSILNFNFLEVGNITLLQALALIGNYLQKKNKPNSGYNYLGLASRMALGIGLHKEFQGWNISPLKMEIRRRVWWTLCVFDVGATVTFSRPSVWPFEGVEVSLPMNVDDRSLTAMSKTYPPETDGLTPYTAVRIQSRFHHATTHIYTRVISRPFPSADEMLRVDEELIQPWRRDIPAAFADDAVVPARYVLAHAIMRWRYRNLRIIMYRPFVIRKALRERDVRLQGGATSGNGQGDDHYAPGDLKAYETCLDDARVTIECISDYWDRNGHNRVAAWYALYFLFQAALIPCICLRNDPTSPAAPSWRAQITTTTRTIAALAPDNASAWRCYRVIDDLCGQFFEDPLPASDAPSPPTPTPMPMTGHGAMEGGFEQVTTPTAAADNGGGGGRNVPGGSHHHGGHAGYHGHHGHHHGHGHGHGHQGSHGHVGVHGAGHGGHEAAVATAPIDESPETQINSVFHMMWPNVPPLEAADVVMGDDSWMEFLKQGSMDDEGHQWFGDGTAGGGGGPA